MLRRSNSPASNLTNSGVVMVGGTPRGNSSCATISVGESRFGEIFGLAGSRGDCVSGGHSSPTARADTVYLYSPRSSALSGLTSARPLTTCKAR
jgi:hypothetical protein